jgi:putative membrane protein
MPDRGLQAERTSLAWRRTALSLLITLLLCARVVVDRGSPVLNVLLATALVLAALLVAFGGQRYVRAVALLRGNVGHPGSSDGVPLAGVAALTVMVGLLEAGWLLTR